MTESHRAERMSIEGDSFAEALGHVLDAVTRLAFVADQPAARRSARFQTEAATLPELVRDAIDEIMSLPAALDMAVVDVSVDGHRPIDGGHRCWGTVELAPHAVELSVVIVDGPHVARDPDDGRWRIDLAIISD